MRCVVLSAVLASVAIVAPARGADQPVIAPAPDWVKPVAPANPPAKSDDAPFRILLSSQQVRFEPGRETAYQHTAIKIQTPQGLAAGNVSLPWRPETDVLTVHRLVIRRGDQVIDVLASGQKFTVIRRETNLESATLDGVLTANIQPEGLQVGDVLELATSITSVDPVFKGHVETGLAAWNGIPYARAHMLLQWPATLPLRVRATGALPPLKPVKSGAGASVELSIDDVQPVAPPKGAPPRYAIGRLVEASDFASWADVGALLAPLYDKAATLPPQGALQAEVARIRAASSDPKARAQAALTLVQDRIRYVALAMGQGGLVPADVETTWSRRYGDCKGKTAMLLALLKALDIQAEPVAVNTTLGDGMDERLPMVGLFNHVLVRASIAGRTYWLDGTRNGDASIDRLTVPSYGWGLPLVTKNAALVRMVPAVLEQPTVDTVIRLDASEGISVPAKARIVTVLRHDEAIGTNLALSALTGDVRDRALRDYWRGQYDFIEPEKTTAAFDPKTGELTLAMEGRAKMDWSNGRYETDGQTVGYRADLTRDATTDKAAPFAVGHPFYTRVEESILLPRGFDRTQTPAEVNETVGGVEYRRKATLQDRTFTITTTQRSVAAEFPGKDAPSVQERLRELAKNTVYLRVPAGYAPTDGDLAVMKASTPKDAAGFVSRGIALMDRGSYDEAIADFDRALALDPKNSWAFANRAVSRAIQGKFAEAMADVATAAAIDPRNYVVAHARGLVAEKQGNWSTAVAAYSEAIDVRPSDMFALIHRAKAHRQMSNLDAALADTAAAIKINPQAIEAYEMRMNILRNAGRQAELKTELDAMLAANPRNGFAFVVAGNFYGAAKRQADAMKAYTAALAIRPEAYIYVNRAQYRPKEDRAGQEADFQAALKLEPDSVDALGGLAKLKLDGGEFGEANKLYSQMIAADPDSPRGYVMRGIASARAGNANAAEKDFAAARARAKTPEALNGLCWAKATAGVALESALADCDAALKLAPQNAAALDSRGFTLLRLGRTDDAIAAYDAALARSPQMSASLFGRGVAWSYKGEKARSEADLAAAAKVDMDVTESFEGYGVTPKKL